MAYRFREDVSYADIAFEVSASDLKELFRDAGLAVTNTMVNDLSAVHQRKMKMIEIEGKNVEELLFNFLQELIFLKDAELMLYSKIDFNELDETKCVAVLWGERLDTNKHELTVDVKAVTMHMFSVKRVNAGWEATVVVDV